jgi:hypothetical protein
MKKILSTVAALGLVAGFASTAAALDFSMTGSYVVEGYHLSRSEMDHGGMDLTTLDEVATMSNFEAGEDIVVMDTDGDEPSDAYYMHTFQILPTMKVNDSITMFGDIRLFKESMFGKTTDNGNVSDADGTGLDIDKVYMEYLSPIGKIRVGRVSTGLWEGDFLNTAGNGNRIMLWPSFVSGPWSMCMFTQKIAENDARSTGDDRDKDLYEIGIRHKGETGEASIAYDYYRYADGKSSATGDSYNPQLAKIWGKYNISNFTLEVEGAYVFGDASVDEDYSAYGFMIDLGTKFGGIDVGVNYFMATGDNDDEDNDNEALLSFTSGTGNEFKPYYILTGDHTGILNNDPVSGGSMNQFVKYAGVNCLGVRADYAASDKLSLHGAIAYGWADKELADNQDDSYGIEYNIGAAYKLLDNLTYEAHFGYLDTGDFFQYGADDISAESVYLVSNHLSMKF